MSPDFDHHQLKFKDFVPKQVKPSAFLTPAVYASMEDTLLELDQWVIAHPDYRIINIETVVLPNIHKAAEKGSTDPELKISQSDGIVARWHQFFRVWYR